MSSAVTEKNIGNDQSTHLMRYATYASISVAFIIVIFKFFAWHITESVSLLSSLADSFLDIIASLINMLAVHYAIRPPDKEHRFGHGKAEDLAALLQAGFILASALYITSEAIGRFMNPQPMQHTTIGIGVMAISIGLTLALVYFQSYVIKRTESTVIQADRLHYLADVMVNGVVIGVFALSYIIDWYWVDPFCALVIAVYIAKTSWGLGKGAFDNLMDREFADEEREAIVKLAVQHPEVKGVHDLKTRISGMHRFIQFHLEMDGNISLYHAHEISDEIVAKVREAFPNADITIHQDPEDIDEDRVQEPSVAV